MTQERLIPALASRRAGVLLHPTSLPGKLGALGEEARRFIDLLARAGVTVWQMLPVGPTHQDRSPYNSLSANAGNPELIDLQELVMEGWLDREELPVEASIDDRRELLGTAANRYFKSRAEKPAEYRDSYDDFVQENSVWLYDYVLFQVLRDSHQGASWRDWSTRLRDRDPEALEQVKVESEDEIKRVKFEQFVFNRQWLALRRYGRERGIYLFGDIPIFVAHDSADVWAHRNLFKLDEEGEPLVVAGVPPDYFSESGQHWGNPLYNWEAMEADGFQWWLSRLGVQQKLFDLIRIDHFRGLVACWEIPAGNPDARLGQWVDVPGNTFLQACFKTFPSLPLVAENLGLIGEDVESLRETFDLPGMAVLQFGFDGSAENPHLNHNHNPHDVIYTGTHDNDTSLGWYLSQGEGTRARMHDYIGSDAESMPWCLMRLAMQSVSWLAIVPLQDVLGLDASGRLNTPGTGQGNWRWHFKWEDINMDHIHRLRHFLELYGRMPPTG
ncbi:4-alpha-glucanotransferase [Marinimicrobium sp. ABcell2]|uniref:4-alpha-glucanotransferase n=1 Tax=Marinimicrobium sp. ABcell2 TaxID=3069751 RepID=UPI0027B061F6|nr:4-alpha-glucanotransferase [Marinimicrobium sp. ABcell2]MDQ2075314.1 4-alpha-glucanotransferase [Marinimicrobium sp. ABcell2]